MSTTRIADHLGRVLDGRYRLLAPIGTGASAHVFLADDVRLGRRVAVKVLHPALADDAAFLKRFRAEARAAAALTHPHILAVFDWGEGVDGPYIVTEYLGGGSLRALLDRGHRLSPSQALVVGLEASRALDFAHRRGFVHRDVKPANLLFDEEGRLRIADFGLARALAEASWTEPTGGMLGTARYAAPEQAQGRPVDGKADVYALAVLLVEAVTGRVPFDADTAVGTLMGRVGQSLEVPSELGPLAAVVSAAGRVDPAERSDAMALGAGLQRVAGDLPGPEPLPVAGPATLDDAVIAGLSGTPTDLVGARSAGASPGSEPSAATAVATPVVPDEVLAEDGRRRLHLRRRPPPAVPPPARAGRRRRWPRALLVVLLVGAVAGVGAYALVQAQIPTHEVPPLVDLQQAEATGQLEALKLGWEVVNEYVDGTEVGQVTGQRPVAGTDLKEGRTVTLTVSLGPPLVDIPDLTGLDQAAAAALLAQRGFAVAPEPEQRFDERAPAGQVLDWAPRDQQLPKGEAVALVVSAGPAPRPVPQVAGLPLDQARKAIEDLGLVVRETEAYHDEVPKGRVVSTDPGAGQRVPRGGTVTVAVSLGKPKVPNIIGRSVDEARSELEAVGLRLGAATGAGGPIIAAFPQPGASVPVGSAVAVVTGFSF